jgi:hypothetical protein
MQALLLSLALTARADDPAPAASGPTIADFTGTWFVTSKVDTGEVVDWGCTTPPDTIEFGDGYIVLVLGGDTQGGAIKSTAPKSGSLVVSTTLAPCTSTKDVTVKWADAGKKIAEITRCAGNPRTVRAVRNDSSGIRIARQCCDANGKYVQRVGINDPCPAGLTAQKPTPLRP